jgi:hypothetical protein
MAFVAALFSGLGRHKHVYVERRHEHDEVLDSIGAVSRFGDARRRYVSSAGARG